MQLDFHFYCIGALAKLGGFSEKDALTIAYASQYVDDSTESEPIRVGDILFDTVRTAHIGIRCFDWSVQKKIYFPFHFLPPAPVDAANKSFVTHPGSPLARMLFGHAAAESDTLIRLCLLGTALHTIADTTAHRGFSGRHHKENDVECISLFENGKYTRLKWQNAMYDLLPQIGHTEAGHFPDLPYLKWKFKNHDGATVARNNPDEFLSEAQEIYELLCGISPKEATVYEWDRVRADISELLRHAEPDVEKRCQRWRKKFGKHFKTVPYNYDKYAWRMAALGDEDEAKVAWDKKPRSHFSNLRFKMKPGFFDSLWVKFHRAALRHRHFVLENMI